MKIKIRKLNTGRYVLFSLLIAGVLALDQLTKRLAAAFLTRVATYPLWEGVLHLTYVENTGAAFGMLKDARWVFLIGSSVAIVLIGAYLYSGFAPDRLCEVGLSFIIGGGIGNMIDRIALGYVVDFIDFRLIHFAVFNGADSFVCVGAGLVILSILRSLLSEAKGKSV